MFHHQPHGNKLFVTSSIYIYSNYYLHRNNIHIQYVIPWFLSPTSAENICEFVLVHR